jgi:hypothetical protein
LRPWYTCSPPGAVIDASATLIRYVWPEASGRYSANTSCEKASAGGGMAADHRAYGRCPLGRPSL